MRALEFMPITIGDPDIFVQLGGQLNTSMLFPNYDLACAEYSIPKSEMCHVGIGNEVVLLH
jgi:hypothetical protein